MDIFILRHGAAEPRSGGATKDSERKLTPDGKGGVREVARFLLERQGDFDRIITSPYARAYETAKIAGTALNLRDRIEVWDELVPACDISAVFGRLGGFPPDHRILLVGHEPCLSTLIGRIISGSDGTRIALAKGGCAKIRNVAFSPSAGGELQWIVTPALIRRIRK